MKEEFDVSVIVICYNQEQTIQRTIESILNQDTTCRFNIIIGDDASTDRTRNICEDFQNRYANIISVIDTHENYGVVRNYELCLERCSGKYIMECAGDDWWSNPKKMQLQFDFMETHEECVLCHGGYIKHYTHSGENIVVRPHIVNNPAIYSLISFNAICAPTVSIRKSAMDKIGFSDFVKEKFWCEDYPSWLALSLVGEVLALDEPLVSYTVNQGSLFHVKTYEERLKAIEADDNARRFICNRAAIYTKYEELIKDTFYRDKTKISILFGKREEALHSVRSIKNPKKKERLKILICAVPFLFKLYQFKYIKSVKYL